MERQTGGITRLSAWMFTRYRSNYVPAAALASIACIAVVIGVPGAIGTALWSEVETADGNLFSLISACIVLVSALVSIGSLQRGTIRPIKAWLSGEAPPSRQTWIAVQRLPAVSVGRAAALVFVLEFVLALYRASTWGSEDQTWAAVWLVTSGLMLNAGGAAFVMIAMTVFMRPVAAELSLALSGEALPLRIGLSVRTRLLLGTGALCASASVLSARASGGARTPVGQLGLMTGAAFVVSLYQVWVADAGLGRTVLAPLADLKAATERVSRGDFSQPAPTTTADELGEVTAAFNSMQRGLAQREQLRSAFGSYVDPELAERLLTEGRTSFDGEEMDLTAMFVDIREFTPFAEVHGATEAVARLNQLFDLVVPIIHDQRGHVNKFLGDGLLAVFGAPSPLADHADRAVRAAGEMQEAVARRFQGEVRIGVGINSGSVIVGTIGGGGKLEFSLVGDAVNVAARVEQLTKTTGDGVLVTSETRTRLHGAYALETRGGHDLKGKSRAVEVFALLREPRA